MIDIKSFNKALKSTWVKKYLDNDIYGMGMKSTVWEIIITAKYH